MQNIAKLIEQPRSLANHYDLFMFDMDGVFWRADHILSESIDYINYLKQNNKTVLFMTNANINTRQHYHNKFNKLGYQTELDHIYTSASLTSQYLQTQYPEIKKIFVIGQQGLIDELTAVGLQVVSVKANELVDHHQQTSRQLEDIKQLLPDKTIQAVVQGIDYDLNYKMIQYAGLAILYNQGCVYLQTNPDRSINVSKDIDVERKIPGTGCVGAILQYYIERKADMIVGKPNPYFVDHVVSKYGFDKSKCLFVGDNLETDIKMAEDTGISSLLVLSGVTNLQKLQELKESDTRPTYYSTHLF